MTEDDFPYDSWVSDALQSVLRTALSHLQRHGFSGDHHFYINFDTTAPQVRMPGFLRAQYPEEITIVLQHQFDDLVIEAEYFEVTLSFSGQKQRLHIPFDAVKSFADPSVSFGLQISMVAAAEEPQPVGEAAPEANIEGSTWRTGPIGEIDRAELEMPAGGTGEEPEGTETGEDDLDPEHEGANVITLDQFRKKSP